ncbi:MAG TPA: hypothetical protein VIJ94_02890 [Caulobacteraceae bacterium]
MRFLALGLMAAVLAAALTPAGAYAADKDKKLPGQGDAKSHAQAMMDAPPLIQQVGINCTPTDANFMVGKSNEGGKATSTKIYELVCQQGLGWMIFAPEGGAPTAFDCLALSERKPKAGEADKGQIYCRLPQNADPAKGLAATVAQTGTTCQIADGRWRGTSADNKMDQYEIACTDSNDFVLQVPRGGTPKPNAVNCIDMKAGECQYLPKDKYLAQLTAMGQASGRPCQVTDGRFMGRTPANHSFFELACSDEKSGYVLETDQDNHYVRALDCGRAAGMGLGCELTSAAAVQTSEDTTYTEAAKAIGFNCPVSGYHQFGVDSKTGREVVELSCTGHPESYISLLPVDKGQTGAYINCVRAAGIALKCVLSPMEATYAKLSSDVSQNGKSCQVTSARDVGTTADGDDYVEAACAGGPGVVIRYPAKTDTAKSVQTCAAAKATGLTCTLSK